MVDQNQVKSAEFGWSSPFQLTLTTLEVNIQSTISLLFSLHSPLTTISQWMCKIIRLKVRAKSSLKKIFYNMLNLGSSNKLVTKRTSQSQVTICLWFWYKVSNFLGVQGWRVASDFCSLLQDGKYIGEMVDADQRYSWKTISGIPRIFSRLNELESLSLSLSLSPVENLISPPIWLSPRISPTIQHIPSPCRIIPITSVKPLTHPNRVHPIPTK